MMRLLFLLLLTVVAAGCHGARIHVRVGQDGYSGPRPMPVRGLRRLSDIRSQLTTACKLEAIAGQQAGVDVSSCSKTLRRWADYRFTFTLNRRPYGEIPTLTWAVYDKTGKLLGQGFTFTVANAIKNALATMRGHEFKAR